MVKKTVTFKNFEGEEISKDFYFNLNKMEFRVLDRKIPGGLENMIQRIQQEKDIDRMIDLLDMLILESYGEKSEDGRFVKVDPWGRRLCDYFKISEAWDVLFMALINNEDELNDFLMGIIPSDAAELARENLKNANSQEAGNLTPVPVK